MRVVTECLFQMIAKPVEDRVSSSGPQRRLAYAQAAAVKGAGSTQLLVPRGSVVAPFAPQLARSHGRQVRMVLHRQAIAEKGLVSRREILIEKMRRTPGSIRFVEVEAPSSPSGIRGFQLTRKSSHLSRFQRPSADHRPAARREKDLRSRRHQDTPGGPGVMMTTTHVYRGFVFTITYRVDEPGYVVRYADISDIITSGATLTEAFARAVRPWTCTWRACKRSVCRFRNPDTASSWKPYEPSLRHRC